jgi:hypothetical protein
MTVVPTIIRLLALKLHSLEMENYSNNVIMYISFYTTESRELSGVSALNVLVIPFVKEIQGN